LFIYATGSADVLVGFLVGFIILKTVIQAIEITEDTEKDWLSPPFFAHPKGE
jgi:hypothetical protein